MSINKKKKIVVIGAGSSSFGLSTLAEIMLKKDLHGMELCLVDVNLEGVNKIRELAEILNQEWNSGMSIKATSKREEVLPEADYIIISIAIDREKCWKKDYEIALKYNISHYAENGGPGGFIHSARNISMFIPILEDINKLCPNAFILNLTNPMQRLCYAIYKLTNNKFVGLCDQIYFGFFIIGNAFADEIGLKIRKDPRFLWNDDALDYHFNAIKHTKNYFDIKAAGINHFTWLLDIRKKESGKDCYDLLRKKMEKLPATFEPLTQKIFKIFNYLPVSGDCHISEYLPYVSDLKSGTFKEYDIQMYSFKWGEKIRNEMWNNIDLHIRKEKDLDDLKHSLNEEITEAAARTISSIETNKNSYIDSANIPNKGNISNIPNGSIVEVPCITAGQGIIGLSMGDLPKTIAELCRRQIILNEMTLQAVIEGNIKLVYQLFSLDPMINNLNTAKKLADEYIRENKKYLTTFF